MKSLLITALLTTAAAATVDAGAETRLIESLIVKST